MKKYYFMLIAKLLVFSVLISTFVPTYAQKSSGAKTATAVKGKRQTFAGYSLVLPEGMTYAHEENGMASYMDPSGKLVFSMLSQQIPQMNLSEFKQVDDVAKQAAAEGKCTVEQFVKMIAQRQGLNLTKPTKSYRVAFEECMFDKMSSMLARNGLSYQRSLLPKKTIRKNDYTLIYSSSQPHTTTFGVLFDYKNKTIFIATIVEANVDNRARMATLQRSSGEDDVEKVADSLKVKELGDKFVESIRNEQDNISDQLQPYGDNIQLTIEHDRFSYPLYGMNVNYSFDVKNADALPLPGTVGFRIIVLEKDSKQILYDDAKIDRSLPNENNVSHYSGTFFVPYKEIKYKAGVNTFIVHFAVVNDNDTKEIGSKDINTSTNL